MVLTVPTTQILPEATAVHGAPCKRFARSWRSWTRPSLGFTAWLELSEPICEGPLPQSSLLCVASLASVSLETYCESGDVSSSERDRHIDSTLERRGKAKQASFLVDDVFMRWFCFVWHLQNSEAQSYRPSVQIAFPISVLPLCILPFASEYVAFFSVGLKGIYFCWTYLFCCSRGLMQMNAYLAERGFGNEGNEVLGIPERKPQTWFTSEVFFRFRSWFFQHSLAPFVPESISQVSVGARDGHPPI